VIQGRHRGDEVERAGRELVLPEVRFDELDRRGFRALPCSFDARRVPIQGYDLRYPGGQLLSQERPTSSAGFGSRSRPTRKLGGNPGSERTFGAPASRPAG